MDNATRRVKSRIQTCDPIDLEELKSETQRLGPLLLTRPTDPYSVEITVAPCHCAEIGCTEQLIVVWRRAGLFSIQWLISPEELQSYHSLDDFRHAVIIGALDDTEGERQIIEEEIEQVFFSPYYQIEPISCGCKSLKEGAGQEKILAKMLLSQLALYLKVRDGYLEYAVEKFGEEIASFASDVFDQGYFMGRVYSEYSVKRTIEPHALAGQAFASLKAKRARAAGEKSSFKRLKRIEGLLDHMEVLAASNPALLRLEPLVLAEMACQDVAAHDPSLWAQGAGQIDEYLGLLRRGEAGPELQSRYLKLFPG